MGLLSKLKSMLGMDERDRSRGSGVDVTVERDPGAESASTDEESADAEEPAAAGTDAAASTESLVDEDSVDNPKKAAEPGEAAQPATDTPGTDEDAPGAGADVEPDDGAGTDEDDEADAEADADEDDDAAGSPDVDPDVELGDIKGIGPAYEERLRDAGIDSVADLAAADADELADTTDLSPKRVGRWIEHAQDQ